MEMLSTELSHEVYSRGQGARWCILQKYNPPKPTKCITAKIIKEAKTMAEKDMFRAARAIVKGWNGHCSGTYQGRLLGSGYEQAQTTDATRRAERSSLWDFFTRELVTCEGRRHLIFATDEQLDLLKDAARWYLDATFKVVRPEFVKLFSIHALVREGEHSKQVPLMFVLMSGRRAIDYFTVFERAVRPTQLQGFVLDFEKAMWKALRQSFPSAKIQGCFFQWTQAVWKKVMNLGLQTEYLEHRGSYCFLRQDTCLPFLPTEHIPPTFEALAAFNSADHLVPLLDYIQSTWIESSWHRRLNQRAGDSPPFYVLLNILHCEAEDAVNQVLLVTELETSPAKEIYYNASQSLCCLGQLQRRNVSNSTAEKGFNIALTQGGCKYRRTVNFELCEH